MTRAKVIADSISPTGKRLTTFEWEYQRFIHSEVMTHRMLSKNAASSRAIPVETTIKQILNDPAMPVFWGKNQAGMSAAEELGPLEILLAKSMWLEARDKAIQSVRQLVELGLHKQIANRALEPWVNIKIVVSGTDLDNFFHLRRHKDAQPEIHDLADCAWAAREASTPILLQEGEWHLPYVDFSPQNEEELQQALKLSASLCAQVSYRKSDESIEKAIMIYDRLVSSTPVHASPFEHQATPLDDAKGVSGNFRGWKQFRELIPFNTCYNYKPNE